MDVTSLSQHIYDIPGRRRRDLFLDWTLPAHTTNFSQNGPTILGEDEHKMETFNYRQFLIAHARFGFRDWIISSLHLENNMLVHC